MRSVLAALFVLGCAAAARAQDAAAADAPPAAEATAAEASVAEATAPGWGAIVLSFGGDAGEAMNAEARDGATASLLAQGFTVLAEAEITARVSPSRLREASSIDALRAIATELGAESVVSVAVWTSGGAADSVIVSIAPARGPEGEPTRSYSSTESVGEAGLAAAAQAATLAALERRTRAAMLGGGSGHVVTEPDPPEEDVPPEDDPWAEERPGQQGGVEALFGIIGPGLLLAIGGTGVGLGIYAVLDGSCQVRAPMSGDCLQGDAPNVGLGVALMIGGVLAAGGAAVWWVTGATSTNEPPPVDGIAWQDGFMLRYRGRF